MTPPLLRRARFPLIVLIAALVVTLDIVTKNWFLRHYQLGESRSVTSFLFFTLVHNTGTAFGLFQNNNRLLLLTSYAVLAMFVYSARGLSERGGGWGFLGVALVIGGAIGNIVDRHRYGQVIDFIDFRVWPVFNLADSAITVGAILIAIGLLTTRPRYEKPMGSRL
jgi:signal peptidase II